jgi:large subunit ribosomal protein L2
MRLIKLNPKTPGTRHQLNLTKNLLSKKSNLYKKLIYKIHTYAGRSSQTGHITVRQKGGGCKKKFIKIRFNSFNTIALVLIIKYDSYRNSFISLNFDLLLKCFFISTAVQTTFPGSIFTCQKKNSELYFGNRSLLANFPIGILVHNVSLSINKNNIAKLARSSGAYCQIVQKKNKIKIRVPSGNFISVDTNAFATFGIVSNIKYNLTISGKAGRNRHKGIRPHVRGIAMNPVDHPHGGRTKGGRPSVTP